MAKKEIYDLIIIGSGPGGYVAAVRAAQLGLKTACVEKETRLGGVCLNIGCIPSKALLDSSEYYHLAKDHFAEHGIKTGRLNIDLPAMMARKDRVVEELTGNIRKLLEGNTIKIIHGTARLAGEDRVEVRQNAGASGDSRPWRQNRLYWLPAALRSRFRASSSTENTSSLPPKPLNLRLFPGILPL